MRRILTIPRAQFFGHSDTVWMASSHHVRLSDANECWKSKFFPTYHSCFPPGIAGILLVRYSITHFIPLSRSCRGVINSEYCKGGFRTRSFGESLLPETRPWSRRLPDSSFRAFITRLRRYCVRPTALPTPL